MALNGVSNFGANMAHRNLRKSSAGLSLSLAKLSAGRRVLSAKDDAAAMAIGARLAAETSGLKQAQINAGQGSSMLQVADGGMARINDVLTRMKSLAVQAGSGSLSSAGRSAINTEFQALASEVDRISEDTEFTGTKLLDGSSGSIDFKIGTGADPSSDELSVSLSATTTSALSLGGADVLAKGNADAAIGAINNAIDTIQIARTQVGAGQSRLEFASANIATAIENTEAARSGLIDLDIAAGTSDLANKSTQYQAGISMLGKANQQSKHLLRLLI
ncbi:MAG: flagellin [Proteobacteria bacterium]|nr:flagellin [Pseudomonadota bacterium]